MASKKIKLIRTSTIPLSLKMFCKELLCEIREDYDVLAVSSSGKELDELKALGINTRNVEMRREISPINDLKSLFSLIRLFRKERPQIVHSITPKAGLLTMIAAKIAGVPLRIHSFTGLLFPSSTGLKRLILKTTDSITCACATHILPEGQGVKRDLQRAGITQKPLQVLGFGNLRGIDLDHFVKNAEINEKAAEIRAELGITKDAFVFVFVGRIVKDKGITELIDAFTRLIEEKPETHLLMVGEEEFEGNAISEETRAKIDACDNIHCTHGWVDDVRPYYAASHALVFPSYREGFPNVVLEAGAMGLPSIVTDINGSNEIVTEGINGTIIPTHDSDRLYDAMLAFVNDRETIKRMSERYRKNIEEKYDARYVRQCLKDYYSDISSLIYKR